MQRRKQVRSVEYTLHLWFEKRKEAYKGLCSLQVECSPTKDLVLNTVSKVQSLHVNKKLCSHFKQDASTITIPARLLKKNNSIDIAYTAKYDHTGTGLHHFTDPNDNKEYLYTQFEPFDAHKLFPCFDQPDIKATYQLTVTAPSDWTIITNTWEQSTKKEKTKTTTSFKRTKPLSTYLFHVSAGPFVHFKDSHKGMPLRIFCRESLKKWIPHKDMFTVTKQGLDFYSKYFSTPYPFDKYDQIFCPEFNHGAMENAGAITFSEHLLARRELTYTERSTLANVVLHEMVHMWFGDLVTMKWWDDVWLNESFADFLSYVGMFKATEFKTAWQSFYHRKAWAYMQDQLITTHPIANDAKDTDAAFANFDGISYSKGAATLKQLVFFIGEKAFQKGLKHYFNTHKWKNTTLTDFRKSLEIGHGKSLKKWFDVWIGTTGVNTIVPALTLTKNNRIKNLTIEQIPSDRNSMIRPHKMRLALIYHNTAKILEFSYNTKKTTLQSVRNWPAPLMIHCNFGDHDYVKVRMDPRSMRNTLQHIDIIVDPLVRTMLYGDLWQMVRDAKLNPKTYLDCIIAKAPLEDNLELLETLVGRAAMIMARYLPERLYEQYAHKLFDVSHEMIMSPKTTAALKPAWFDLLLATVPATNNTSALITLLNNKKRIPGLAIDQDKRWRMLARLAAIDHKGIDSLLQKERKKDRTDMGEKFFALACAAQLKNKEKVFNMLVRAKGPSLDHMRRQMTGFYWRVQKDKLAKFTPKFFAHIKDIYNEQNRTYAQAFFTFMFPSLYTSKELLMMTKRYYTEQQKDLPQLLKKSLREAVDEMSRTLRILDKYGK